MSFSAPSHLDIHPGSPPSMDPPAEQSKPSTLSLSTKLTLDQDTDFLHSTSSNNDDNQKARHVKSSTLTAKVLSGASSAGAPPDPTGLRRSSRSLQKLKTLGRMTLLEHLREVVSGLNLLPDPTERDGFMELAHAFVSQEAANKLHTTRSNHPLVNPLTHQYHHHRNQNKHRSPRIPPKENIDWIKVQPPPPEMIVNYDTLKDVPHNPNLLHCMLDKLVVLKLNGGLGTRMGCKGPKSAIEVRQELTFLDLTVRQVEYLNLSYGVDVPLIVMNSFRTSAHTEAILRKYRNHHIQIHCFEQSCYPRIYKDTLMPVPTLPFGKRKRGRYSDNQDAWYPPGHGDVYESLARSGLLENLIVNGKEYIFISNVDNLGATVDLKILYQIMTEKREFVMEVTKKTRADVVGGTLIQYNDNIHLVEMAQVPKAHHDDFRSIKKYKHFNTNNLWVKLDAIQRVIATKTLPKAVIVNTRDHHGNKVLQLETAAGAAVRCFCRSSQRQGEDEKGPLAIVVDRNRFLPIKTCADLMVVQSDAFNVRHGSLYINEDRKDAGLSNEVPIVKLGQHYDSVNEFVKRMEHGVPSMVECDHLTVSGDVYFGKDVKLKGSVIIVATEGQRLDIPSGSELDNVVVTGSLNILKH